MIVQAVCLPEGSKMLVIPTFFPIIPFMLFNLCLQDYWDILHFAMTDVTFSEAKGQSPFATDLFFFLRSTGSKQTLNGLFLFRTKIFTISNDYYEINPGDSELLYFFSEVGR